MEINDEKVWTALIVEWLRTMDCKYTPPCATISGMRIDFNFNGTLAKVFYDREELIIQPFNEIIWSWRIYVPLEHLDIANPNKTIQEIFRDPEDALRDSIKNASKEQIQIGFLP